MTYPYEEGGELYHKQCLPSNDALVFADEVYEKYLGEKVYKLITFTPTFNPPSLARCEQVELFRKKEIDKWKKN